MGHHTLVQRGSITIEHVPHPPSQRSELSKIPCSYFEAIHRHGLAYGDTPPELSVVTRRPAFSLSPRCLAASIAAAGGSRRRAWSTRPLGPLRSSADPILQSIPDRLDPLNSTNRLPARLVVPQQPHRPRRHIFHIFTFHIFMSLPERVRMSHSRVPFMSISMTARRLRTTGRFSVHARFARADLPSHAPAWRAGPSLSQRGPPRARGDAQLPGLDR